MTTRNVLAGISLFCALTPAAASQSGLILPTPRDHYKTYNVDSAGLELMGKVLEDSQPQILKVVEFLQSKGKTGNSTSIEPEELLKFVREAGSS